MQVPHCFCKNIVNLRYFLSCLFLSAERKCEQNTRSVAFALHFEQRSSDSSRRYNASVFHSHVRPDVMINTRFSGPCALRAADNVIYAEKNCTCTVRLLIRWLTVNMFPMHLRYL